MPDKPASKKEDKKVPTYEELEKAIGIDAMSFMSEMLKEPGDEEE